jgi:D-glycerate 3-kinase
MKTVDLALSEILCRWENNHAFSKQEKEWLADLFLVDQKRAKAFGITPANIENYIESASEILDFAYPKCLARFGHSFTAPALLQMLWEIWLPLALQLIEGKQNIARPLVQGILGGQGAGKTTLAAAVTLILEDLGYRTVRFSLDDLYKTYADRCQLRVADPRLVRRGPPGTHDVDLGVKTLRAFYEQKSPSCIKVPRFDKSLWQGEGDRVAPEMVTQKVDFVLFEGWFVGVQPVDNQVFLAPPEPIATEADRQFAQDMNKALQGYLPLWRYLDRLLVLYLPDYRLSKQWRKQAEHQMIAQGKQGMTDLEIDAFVEYFWRSLHPELFIQPLIERSDLVDLVIEINADHSPGRVYAP